MDQGYIVEADPFTLRSRHGFYGELVSKIDTFEEPSLKEIGNDVLKTGLLALSPEMVQKQCLKWVDERVVPVYLFTI